MAEVTPEKLHQHAVAAEKHLEQLATGLGQAGAPDPAVKTVSQMADAVRKIVQSLAAAAQAQPAPEQEAAPAQQPQTMDSATNDMQAELKARRQA